MNKRNSIPLFILFLVMELLFVDSLWARRMKPESASGTNLSVDKQEVKIRELKKSRQKLNEKRAELEEQLKQLKQKRDLAREYLKGATTKQGRKYLEGVIAKYKAEIKSARKELEEINKQSGVILREIYKLEGVIK